MPSQPTKSFHGARSLNSAFESRKLDGSVPEKKMVLLTKKTNFHVKRLFCVNWWD